MTIHISGRQIDDFIQLSPGGVTGCGGWRAGRKWCRLWSPHSASGRGRCTCSLGSPACLRILCSAILARKAAGRLVMPKHCRVSLYRSLHLFMPRNSTPRFFSSRTSARGFLMRYFVSSVAAREKPSFAIVAIFNARRMSDCSSCTRPPCLAIVADMLKTYKTLVGASNNEIWLLLLPYPLQ
jgi:hypothetical protein